jgi:DNA-binding beta-propeller fold protein YncE
MHRLLLCSGPVALAVFLLPGLLAPALALQVTGLQSPQSFVSDQACDCYFISSINGEPDARDNNGFITKLDRDGKVVAAQFIRGGDGPTVLHAPKGMVIVNHLLYVADLDTLRAFDVKTGKSVTTVSFTGQPGPIGLVDVAADPHGLLYASDMEANVIYRIDPAKQYAVSVLARDTALAGPRGLAVHPKTGHVIAVSWNKGSIAEIAPDGTITELVSNGFFSSRFHNLDGVDFDTWGNMYVSDFTAGKIWRMRPDHHFNVIAEYLPTPAGISVDRVKNLILVPYHYGNTAEMNGLETPGKSRSKNRTLADYGFTGPKPPQKDAPNK